MNRGGWVWGSRLTYRHVSERGCKRDQVWEGGTGGVSSDGDEGGSVGAGGMRQT